MRKPVVKTQNQRWINAETIHSQRWTNAETIHSQRWTKREDVFSHQQSAANRFAQVLLSDPIEELMPASFVVLGANEFS